MLPSLCLLTWPPLHHHPQDEDVPGGPRQRAGHCSPNGETTRSRLGLTRAHYLGASHGFTCTGCAIFAPSGGSVSAGLHGTVRTKTGRSPSTSHTRVDFLPTPQAYTLPGPRPAMPHHPLLALAAHARPVLQGPSTPTDASARVRPRRRDADMCVSIPGLPHVMYTQKLLLIYPT